MQSSLPSREGELCLMEWLRATPYLKVCEGNHAKLQYTGLFPKELSLVNCTLGSRQQRQYHCRPSGSVTILVQQAQEAASKSLG